ncbi:MAG: metallophosphoesterase [Thermoplasmatota archaeon]
MHIRYVFLFYALLSLIALPSHSFSGDVTHLDIVVGPYTQNVTSDAVTILWETSSPSDDNIVEYGNNDTYGFTQTVPSGGTHHEVTIHPEMATGRYRVISDDTASHAFSFSLAPDCSSDFTAVIYGDSRGSWDNWEHAALVADAIDAVLPDMVIHGGDMVDDGRVKEQWASWLNATMSLMQNAPLYGVLGNHERNGSRYYEIFALPGNEMWYSFDYGPYHFVVLDNYVPWGERSSQYAWLREDLARSMQPFKIVCFHEPIYCSGGHLPRFDVRAVWEPLFIEHDVDLVFQSHCHYYQRTIPIGGIIYVVTGGAGAPLYSPEDAWFVNTSSENHHYCQLDVSSADMTITVSARDIDGVLLDRFAVTSDAAPAIAIVRPGPGMYLFNRYVMPLSSTVVVGPVDVEAVVSTCGTAIQKVVFSTEDEILYEDADLPFSYHFDLTAFGRHTITATAYDDTGEVAHAAIDMFIINL